MFPGFRKKFIVPFFHPKSMKGRISHVKSIHAFPLKSVKKIQLTSDGSITKTPRFEVQTFFDTCKHHMNLQRHNGPEGVGLCFTNLTRFGAAR